MWKSWSPTLLLLAMGPMVSWLDAADTKERDQAAAAVLTLVDQRMRLPAKRWLDQWIQAKYPDDGRWIDKILHFRYADRFAYVVTDPKEAEALKKTAADLRSELDQAIKAKLLPDSVRPLYLGSGPSIERIKKEILAIMDPNLPPPQVEILPEKKALLARHIKSLIDQAGVDFDAAMTEAENHSAGPEKLRETLPDSDPRSAEIDALSFSLRDNALKIFITAHSILRDVAVRAKDFGIEPSAALADAWLAQVSSENLNTVADWEFKRGADNPHFRLNCLIFIGEAMRQGIKSYNDGSLDTLLKFEGAESSLTEIITTEVSKADMKWSDAINSARLRSIDQFMRWCVEMKNRKVVAPVVENTPPAKPPRQKGGKSANRNGPSASEIAFQNSIKNFQDISPDEMMAHGLNAWNDFQNLAKKEPAFQLNKSPAALQVDLGFAYLSAARFFLAAKDEARAASLFTELAGAKNMHAGIRGYAQMWLTRPSNTGSSQARWGDPATPADPTGSFTVAQLLCNNADETADRVQQERILTHAIITLRNGIAGLETKTYADQAIGILPKCYLLYVSALSRLGLNQHAAIAGAEGLARITAILDHEEKAKRPNPWKTQSAGKDWLSVTRLTRETYRLAQNVYARNKGFGSVVEATRKYRERIDPSNGPSTDIDEISQLLQDRRSEEAISKCQEFSKRWPADKYPTEELVVFSMLVNARLTLIDKITASKKLEALPAITAALDKDNQTMNARIQKELAQPNLSAQRKRELERTQTSILSCDISSLMRDQKYDEAINRLGPEYWKNPPSDPSLAANMLNKLGIACGQKFNLLNQKPDAESIHAAAEIFQQAYDVFSKQKKRLESARVERDIRRGAKVLSQVFQGLSQIAGQLSRKDPQCAAIEIAANHAYADLFEPLIDDTTKPEEIWNVANVLWNVDAHQRAKKQYERYQVQLDKDSDLQAFKQDPKSVIDTFTAKIVVRDEFKTAWEEIVDLSWDSPEFIASLHAGVPDAKGQVTSYLLARSRLDSFSKGPVANAKDGMDAKAFADLNAAIAAYRRLLTAAANDRTLQTRLALAYREVGQNDKALPILVKLFKLDPTNPDFASGYVEVTILSLRSGEINAKTDDGKKTVTEALEIASRIRNDLERDVHNRDSYWLAYIQGLELSVSLNNIRNVNDTLTFLRINKSDLSRDLIKPKVEVTRADGTVITDDPRARRPLNEQAAKIAERFLALYQLNGISEKPAFRLDPMNDLTPAVIFVDADAPAFSLVTVSDENNDEVSLLQSSPSTSTESAPTSTAPKPAQDAPSPAAAK